MIALFLIVILVVLFLMFKKKEKNKEITKDEFVVIDPDGDINTTTSRSVFETYIKDAEKKGK